MQKIFAAACLGTSFMSMFTTFSYEIHIENNRNDRIQVAIHYQSECSPLTKNIAATDSVTLEADHCCIDFIDIKSTSGSTQGKQYQAHIPPGKNCNNVNISIHDDKNKNLFAIIK